MADKATTFPGTAAHESAGQVVAQGVLEHVNVATSSARETADLFCRVFGWRVRWEGPAKSGGRSIHVGTEGTYVAL